MKSGFVGESTGLTLCSWKALRSCVGVAYVTGLRGELVTGSVSLGGPSKTWHPAGWERMRFPREGALTVAGPGVVPRRAAEESQHVQRGDRGGEQPGRRVGGWSAEPRAAEKLVQSTMTAGPLTW